MPTLFSCIQSVNGLTSIKCVLSGLLSKVSQPEPGSAQEEAQANTKMEGEKSKTWLFGRHSFLWCAPTRARQLCPIAPVAAHKARVRLRHQKHVVEQREHAKRSGCQAWQDERPARAALLGV